MRRLVTAALTLLLAAPAAAQVDAPFTFTDGCGDADQAIIRSPAMTINLETDRGPWHDIDNAKLTPRAGGSLDVELKVCGAVPAPQAVTNNWSVKVLVANDCDVTLSIIDNSYGTPARVGKIARGCVTQGTNELGMPTTSYTQVVTDLPASAWAVAGDTFTWHLTKTQLAAVQAGKVLRDPSAGVVDGAAIGVWTSVGTSGVGVHGPGANDGATSTGTVTLS